MIESFRAQNFKCFSDTGHLQIRPITILLGENSSGKSSILQALLGLKQTLSSRDDTTPLITDGAYVQLGTYKDFARGHAAQTQVTFEWVVPFPPYARDRSLGFRGGRALPGLEEPKSITTTLTLGQNRKTKLIYPLRYRVQADTGSTVLGVTCASNAKPTRLTTDLPLDMWTRRFWRTWLSRENFHFDLFKRFRPPPQRLSREDRFRAYDQADSASSLTTAVHMSTREAFEGILCLGPLRDKPSRMSIVGGETPPDVGLTGESTVNMLLSRRTTGGWQELSTSIGEWLGKFRIASALRLQAIATGVVSVRVTDPKLKVESSLADVGFGASQVLPVIVQGLCAPRGALLLVEQPEIHLHPSAQAEIGDFFVETSLRGKRWLIETHSEHILLRLQRRVAEGEVPPEHVGVYLVERIRGSSRARPLELDEYGRIPEWPREFFASDFEESEARAVAAAKKVRRRRSDAD